MNEASRPGFGLCHCAALRRASRRISQFYDEKLGPTGLRVSQYGILAVLYEARRLSINELARRMALDRTTMGKNLRPLQRDGLVRVSPSESDGRSREIALTAAGLAALKAAAPLWREAQQEFEESNGRQATAALRETLAELRIGS
jgi:DNA-binding MarR family transcriptional regulator